VDLNLTSQQMQMFINGLKYVLPCQSRFSRRPMKDIVNEQFQNMSTVVKNCLGDHRMSASDERAKEAFQELQHILHELYTKRSSRKIQKRAQYENKIVRMIKRMLNERSDIVIRRTDKSKVFYIGNRDEFVRKAEEYMSKTEAYEEIRDGRCPLADNLQAVRTLLGYLLTKQVLTKQQHNRMLPNLNKLELGHYYGLPKPHKVNLLLSYCLNYDLSSSCRIDWNTTSSYCGLYECTIDIDVEIFE
jgi:hypothetical protein